MSSELVETSFMLTKNPEEIETLNKSKCDSKICLVEQGTNVLIWYFNWISNLVDKSPMEILLVRGLHSKIYRFIFTYRTYDIRFREKNKWILKLCSYREKIVRYMCGIHYIIALNAVHN